MNNIDKDIDLDEEIDISELTTLEEQKTCCEKMVHSIVSEERHLKQRLITLQTVNDVVSADDKLKLHVDEYLGYNYGSISVSMSVVDNALQNLTSFSDGRYDLLDHGARGMFLNMWFNFAISHLESVSGCVVDLEKIEGDIVKELMADLGGDDNLIIKGVTFH
jgi:hypothetical protein